MSVLIETPPKSAALRKHFIFLLRLTTTAAETGDTTSWTRQLLITQHLGSQATQTFLGENKVISICVYRSLFSRALFNTFPHSIVLGPFCRQKLKEKEKDSSKLGEGRGSWNVLT